MTTRLRELAYRTGAVLLGVVVLALAVRPLLYPIADPDFFWHLKTGQWIWEHRSLPDSYLFSVTAPTALSATQRLAMTSYWLVQLTYHAAHALGGMAGIGVLRALLLACLLASLAWRREGDILTFLGVAVPAVVLVRIYHFERPQVVSFLFCSLLLGALDRIRRPDDSRGRPAFVAAVPLIMLVWANSHGGFVVGQGVILLYLILEGAKRLHPRLDPMPPGRLRLLLTTGGAGLLASLANPNTWRVWGLAQLPAWLTSFNMEYQSTLSSWRVSNSPVFPTYWLLLALAAVAAVVSRRKPDITRLALLAIMGWYSFTQVRHLGFFVVAAVPAVSAGLSCRGFRTAGRVVTLAAALVVAGFFLPGDLVDLARARPSRVRVSGIVFPTDAADFLDANGVRGDLYGFYGWGGYLLWRLAPARVFIDGRVSDRNVIDMARAVDDGESASVGGVPYWKAVLKGYRIHCVVIPAYNSKAGDVIRLLYRLLEDPEWVPVFAGMNAVVFLENVAENRAVIERFAFSRAGFLELLAERCGLAGSRSPGDPFPLIARGELLTRLGHYAEARQAYTAALSIVPRNELARRGLEALQ